MTAPRVLIADLPEASSAASGDVLVIESAGTTKKITAVHLLGGGTGGSGAPGPPGPPGAQGEPGIVIDDVSPTATDVLWADTSVAGSTGADTVAVFPYTDETVARPTASVVFWIPNPFDLPNPFGALPGDLVLRSTPAVVQGLNGVEGLWQGSSAEYDALTPDPNVVYFVI